MAYGARWVFIWRCGGGGRSVSADPPIPPLESMRILLAVHQFFPQFRAGTETLTLRTAQELQRRGHQVWVLAAGPHEPHQPQLREDRYGDVAVIRFNPPPDPPPLQGGMAESYRRPASQQHFSELLRRLRPDVLHLFHGRRLTVSLLDAAAAGGVPAVVSLTDYWMACPTGQLQFPEHQPCAGPHADGANCLQHLATRVLPGGLRLPLPLWRLVMALAAPLPAGALAALRRRPRVMAATLERCERVLVPTQLMLRTYRQLGFPIGHFEVCPYGLDLDGLAALPPRQPWRGAAQRPLRVGFIGSFNRAKGAHVLLEAVRRLGGAAPLQVQLYGNPADDPVYAGQLQQLGAGVPQLRWAGVFAADAVFAVLQELDVLVVPSLWRENAPLIVLQALASGLPLLLSDVEGMVDQVRPGRNALVFPAGDSGALAALLAEPSRLAALANRGGPPRRMADYGDQLERTYARLQSP